MRYFFDTEFSERGAGHPIDLISIGIVAEDGREFYAECSPFDTSTCNPWVQEHVLPKLWHRQADRGEANRWIREEGHRGGLMTRSRIGIEVQVFVDIERPEFWAYYADYDWVVLCQSFGTMTDLPKGWPMWCRDLKQLAKDRGDPDLRALVPEPTDEHHALADARWVRDAYRAVMEGQG